QPLRPDMAALLRSYLKGRPRNRLVWPGTWKDRAAEMLRIDLAAAGIPYTDEDNRYFDFQGMRGQFISEHADHGHPPQGAPRRAPTRRSLRPWRDILVSHCPWTTTRTWTCSTWQAP